MIISAVQKHTPDRILLDIGGGNGFVTKGLQINNLSAVLLEPGKAGCINARKRGVKNIICATLSEAGIKDGCIDSAGLFDVLEHIEDDLAFLKEIHSRMIKNGKLFITVPAYPFLWSYEDDYTGHFRRYTLPNLISTSKEAGFKCIYSTYLFSILPLPIWFRRVIFSQRDLKKEKPQNKAHKKSFASYLIDWVWKVETKIVKKGIKIPFGSTCFVVLEKV